MPDEVNGQKQLVAAQEKCPSGSSYNSSNKKYNISRKGITTVASATATGTTKSSIYQYLGTVTTALTE